MAQEFRSWRGRPDTNESKIHLQRSLRDMKSIEDGT